MLKAGDKAPGFSLPRLDGTSGHLDSAAGKPSLLVFFETDCPTCRLALPYLNRLIQTLGGESINVLAISQDPAAQTREFLEQSPLAFPVVIDRNLEVSRQYDPVAVPTLFLLNGESRVVRASIGFDKSELNAIARMMSEAVGANSFTLAERFDGAPETKPGCASRHLEMTAQGDQVQGDQAAAANPYRKRAARASLIELDELSDPYEYCLRAGFGDALPVVPPTVDRVNRMIESAGLDAQEVVGAVPPNYGAATVEKIAANAVMAGCAPEMMRVLIPLVRAACDERFNLHGVQATTHFAAPLIIVNGPVRKALGFACGSNVFSNVARANSTLGRALQLILTNLGGARPGEIDMSTLGNSGKFSYCIAENEEESPWPPLHADLGFPADQSAVSIFAAEPPKGVSEHNARQARAVLRAISKALAVSWSYRVCVGIEAVVVLCPEHVETIRRDGFTKQDVREFLFLNTAIPVREFEGEKNDGGEGTRYVKLYQEAMIDGEPCYLKFPAADAIKIVVAGGRAGKFSAVVSSWVTGPRGSQMVTYPID